MAVAPPPPSSETNPAGAKPRPASDQLIEERIEEARKALWWAELIRSALKWTVFAIGALLIWVVVDHWIYSPGKGLRLLAFVGLIAVSATYLYRRVRPLFSGKINPDYAARSLERDHPELRQSLTSYVTLREDSDESRSLRTRVVKSIGSSTARHLRKYDALPAEATGTMKWWVAASVALVLLFGYAAFSPKNTLQSAKRLAAPMASIDTPRRVRITEVKPGDAEAIAGRPVELSAKITGMHSDEEATCYWELPSGRQELTLKFDEEQRRHVGAIPLPHSSSGIVQYRLVAGDAEAGPFALRVRDVPVVALQSVTYTPPGYTSQEPYTSSNGSIAGVDGTWVRILASTNRPIAKAKIEFNPRQLGNRIQATAGATEMEIDSDGTSVSIDFPLRSAQGRSSAVELEGYRIVVADESGQGNPDPIIYPIRVIADLPPECTITVPASSPKNVPINAQQVVEVHASDPDFGLRSIALEIRSGIDLIDRPVLWSSDKGEKGHRVAEYRFRPAEHELQIGDTVEIVAVATDNRESETIKNIEPNVTRTDPVLLVVTASGLLPDETDPSADGLSEPDEKPASQQSSEESNGSESGEEQQGGGGSGGEGGKQQEGGGEGEGGSTGSGTGGESSDQNDSGGGTGGEENSGDPSDNSDSSGDPSGASGGDSSNEGQSDSSTGDSSEGGDQGDTGEGEQPDASDEGSTGQDPASDGSSGEGSAGENMSPEGGGDPNGDSAAQEASGDGAGDNQSNGSNNAGSESNSGNETGSSDSAGSEGQSGNQSSNANDGQSPSSGDPQGGAEGGDQGQQREAPKHDGEAFERIQEYLDKQKQAAQQGGSDNQRGQGQQDSTGSQNDSQSPQNRGSEGESGNQSDSGNESSRGDNGESNSSNTSEQGSGSDSESSTQEGTEGQDSAGSDSSSSQQQDASSNDSSGSGDSSEPDSREGAGSSGDSGDAAKPQQDGGESSPSGDDANASEGAGQSGEQGEGSSDPGDQSDGQGASQERASDNGTSGEQGQQNQNPSADSGDTMGDSANPSDPQPGEPGEANTSASTSAGGSAGDGGDLGDGSGEPPPPPDPANVEYTKEATDLVLDYLEQTREAPDPKLLEDLQWSQDDLRRFTDRWQKVRELSRQGNAEGNREMEEALKSLGMRPPATSSNSRRESGDSLRSIRDSGNRTPPPAPFRDAFDAFRRAVGG